MTTKTVCVPRELLSRFPEINFSNYGQDEVEALQAWAFEAYDALQTLAQPVAPDWRAHSAQFARGEKCPETLETLQAAWARDQELIFDQKA